MEDKAVLFNFDAFLADPRGLILVFLLALPGRLLAISAHEMGHAWVAYKCGDPTARNEGRITLNPMKHLDLMGTLMMVFVGFGWARPVPVNPRNYKHYRRDDLLVSLAGITMNLILFVTGCVVMYALVGVALSRAAANTSNDAYFLEQYGGQLCYFMKGVDYTYLPVSSVLTYAPYLSDYLIAPVFGEVAKYLYEMLMYFTITNLILAVFNLIPVPPLDGYHVLNDLILRKRNLFVSPRVSQVFMVILFVLMLSGYTDFIFDWVLQTALSGVGRVAGAVFSAVGIL